MSVGPKGKYGKCEIEVPDDDPHAIRAAIKAAADGAIKQAKDRDAKIKAYKKAYRRKK